LNTTSLNLLNSGLTGSIPSEIGNLTNLTYLYLYNNELSGSIPPEIGNLTNLTWLWLYDNQLTGSIPSSIGNLTNLTGLFLNNNQLTGRIPSEIGNLTNLTNLDLSDNELTEEIPPEIGNLTNLFQLLLNNNQLMGEIPESICNIDIFWISFPYFDIDNNQLCPPYPDCISEEDIGYQDTSECVECILGDINNDSILNILDIVSMVNLILDGEYDGCGDVNSDGVLNILDVVTLVNIILYDSCNDGEVDLWGECYSIENTTEILLPSSELTGEIPESIGDLINLNSLVLYNNQLSGEIPESIENLTNMMWLNLYNNQLTGEIPESIGNLTNLTSLDLGFNQFSGEIPESLGNLTNLNHLWLYHNQLNGEIPITICNIDQNLEHFYIYDNQLCPPYPECLTEEDVGYQDTTNCEPECDLGDVNCDGDLNVLDVVLMVNMILEDEYISIADLNEDGVVNILDVVTIVNLVLFGDDNTCMDIDGNVYETFQIGGQLWMAENLKVTHYQNSDEIPYIYNDPQYGAYINYSNNADNVGVYGRLYNWFAVNDERGLCPDNWHVPSDDEFKSLEMYLGMSESEANGEGLRGTDEGGKLKEESNEHWNSPNTGATNETGFTALPSGNRRYETYTNQEIFSGLNRYGFFWSSSEVYTVNAWYRVFSFDYSESNRYHLSKTNAFSIRCVED